MLGKKAYTKPYLRTIWQNTSNFAQQMNGENVHISSFILVLKSVFGEENVEENYSPSNNKDIIDIVIYSSSGFLKIFFTKSEDGFGGITSWTTQ